MFTLSTYNNYNYVRNFVIYLEPPPLSLFIVTRDIICLIDASIV